MEVFRFFFLILLIISSFAHNLRGLSQIKRRERSAGILMHITSLPSNYGIGTLGAEAYRFADFLVKAKQKNWQMLPLGFNRIWRLSLSINLFICWKSIYD